MKVTTRRRIARISVAVSFAVLVLVVAIPGLRHHAAGGGIGIVASAVVSILAGLYYLRSTRSRP